MTEAGEDNPVGPEKPFRAHNLAGDPQASAWAGGDWTFSHAMGWTRAENEQDGYWTYDNGWRWVPRPPRKKRSRAALASLLALFTLVAVGAAGAGVGHLVWSSQVANGSSSSSPGTETPPTQPFGGFGFGPNGGSSSGSIAPGGPSDAAAIAKKVDPGLVDINVFLGYQDIAAAGTGMVLSSDGLVLTNNHVIEGETRITVTDVGNHKTYNAVVLGYDRRSDVALVRMEGASGLATVKIGDSSKIHVGEAVVGIGNAGGAGGTPSYVGGSITALDQSIVASDAATGGSEQLQGLIETNAQIQSGDSGGPLVNTDGEVIGMDTAASEGFQFQYTGTQAYAIPINTAMAIVRKIEADQPTDAIHVGPTAFLGVSVEDASANYVPGGIGGFGGFSTPPSPVAQGAEIVSTLPGGPAASAGLQAGDTITSLAGDPVTSAESLTDLMMRQKPGQVVKVGYVDPYGQQYFASVKLGVGPPQ